MPFVLDASIVACWALQDEGDSAADLALAKVRLEEAVVPALFWFEIRNILIVNERRKRLSESDTSAFLQDLSRLRIVVDRDPNESQVLHLARKHRLTVYDSVYLELAQRNRIAIASLDVELLAAARSEGVAILSAA